MRAHANEAEEVLHPEEPKWTITVSALEKVRFEENKKMGAVLADVLLSVVDHTRSFDEAEAVLAATTQELRPVQREKVYAIVQNFRQRLTRYMHDMSYDSDSNRYLDLFYAGHDVTRSEIPEDDIHMTTEGTVVVTVRDMDAWKKVGGTEQQGGFSTHAFFERVPSAISDSYAINKQAERTVFVLRKPEESDAVFDGIRRHEVAHDLYKLSFEKEEESGYENPIMQGYFTDMKDEVISYLLEERWQSDIHAFVTSSVIKECGNVSVPRCLFRSVVSSLLENHSPEQRERLCTLYDQSNMLDLQSIARVDLSILEGYDQALCREKVMQAATFVREFALVPREMERLRLLDSPAHKEALAGCLTAQTLKEILYTLSKIQEKDIPDALHFAQMAVPAIHVHLRNALRFRIPLLHADQLVEVLRTRISPCNKEEREEINQILLLWEQHNNRWVRG